MLKAAVWLHRWLGIALCLLFAIWFASGAVLFFAPFPSLDGGEARARAAPVAMKRVELSPAAALTRLPDARALRLVERGDAPAYVASTPQGDVAVSTETGAPLRPLSAAQAGVIASRFAAASVRAVAGPFRYDQWVAHQAFDPARPLYRVRLADRAATDLYVSAVTGEVVQETTGVARAWNWPGAVVQWIYFTPLRRVFAAWDQTVWWVSLAGLVMAMLGMALGVYRTWTKARSPRPALSPFRGWLKWHHVLGLTGGAVLLTWIGSGWLSMNHGRLFPRAGVPPERAGAYGGLPLHPIAGQVGLAQVRSLQGATAVVFTPVGGRLVAAGLGPGAPRVLSGGAPAAARSPPGLIRAGLQTAFPGKTVSGPQAVEPGDFYARAEGVANGADLYRIDEPEAVRVFVDPTTGGLLAQVDRRRAAYDWAYYALHTFNVPGLLRHPWLRAAIVLPLLALGFALSVTGIVVGAKRLGLKAFIKVVGRP